MSKEDIRWGKRFSNYVKVFNKLDRAITNVKADYRPTDDGTIDDDEFLDNIINQYHPEFLAFRDKMEELRSGNQAELFEEK